MTSRAALESHLGYRFRDPRILERALTHRSSSHETKASFARDDYERMEFLGDALLGFLVSEQLMKADPDADEGALTRRRQSIVSTGALAAVSQRIGLGDALRLGRGEDATGGRGKPSLLADAFESTLAAVYEDGGLRAARAFVRRHLGGALRAAVTASLDDAKTRLQELTQARLRVTPRYRTVALAGAAHARVFTAEVLLGDEVAGRGTGRSRKEAERDAARIALAHLDRVGEEAPR